MEKDRYEVTIKARNIKAHLTFDVRRNVKNDEEETVKNDNVKTSCNEEETPDTKKETVSFKVEIMNEPNSKKLEENDGVIINQPSKTTIVVQHPDQVMTKKIADELNQTEIKGMSSWSPTQDFSMVCILGKIEETEIEKIVQPLIIKVMIESRGDEK